MSQTRRNARGGGNNSSDGDTDRRADSDDLDGPRPPSRDLLGCASAPCLPSLRILERRILGHHLWDTSTTEDVLEEPLRRQALWMSESAASRA